MPIPNNNAPRQSINPGDGIVITNLSTNDTGLAGLALIAQDKILVAGGSNENTYIIRYNSDGTIDSSFSDDGMVITELGEYTDPTSLIIQTDGKLLVAGNIGWDWPNQSAFLIRFNADGTLDNTFATTGIAFADLVGGGEITNLALQVDGKIILAGNNNYDQGGYVALFRFNIDGTLDNTFAEGGIVTTDLGSSVWINDISILSDGKILLAGGFGENACLIRYNSDGTLDSSFSHDGQIISEGYFQSITVLSDGKILAAGTNNHDFYISRYNTDGSLDNTFSDDGIVITDIGGEWDGISDTIALSDGKFLAVGSTWLAESETSGDFSIARYNSDGSLDNTFSDDGIVINDLNGGWDEINNVSITSDGKILVSGASNSRSDFDDDDFALVRYNNDGSLDNTFDQINTIDNSPSFIESGTAVVLDSSAIIIDPELAAQGNYAGASISLYRHQNSNSNDIFSATGNLSSFNEGSDFSISGITIGSVTQNSNGVLKLTFNNNATQVRLNETLSSIAYKNTGHNLPETLQIDWLFSDGNDGSQGSGAALTMSGNTNVHFIPDITPPSIIISSNDSALIAGETAVISFTLSESSTDFVLDDVTVSGGSLSNFSGSGTSYTARFTPNPNSTLNGVVSVGSAKFFDAAGNANVDGSDSDNTVTMSLDTIPNRNPTGKVTITGTATQKQVLTASNTLADADGLGAISYQWLADNVAISGATASTYTLTQSEVGKIIKVAASYVDNRGYAESITSAIPTKAVANVNDAPTLANAISDKSATEGTAFSFTLPSNTFTDIDTGDTLKLTAKLSDGKALPKWLSFNATTGVFSGTPKDADSATSITVRVTGTDKARAAAFDDFVLDIAGVNVAPTAKAITKVATATEGKAFKYALPKGTFTDGDKNDVLTYSATSKPDWLSMDSAGNLTGTPSYASEDASADSSTTSVVFVATDRLGLTATTTLTIKLTNTATIKGTANSETIVAGVGADKITGLAGNDTITGGAGIDSISGGAGNDTLTGGADIDYFLFDIAANASSNLDTITDFVSGTDKLQFSKKVFAGLGKAVGNLTDAQFAYSTESLTTTDRIIYNTSTGALYYDADGSGSASSAVQVALIGTSTHPSLAVIDIQIGN
jgi:uncharacterized delta-60 repeat protein